MAKKRQKRVVQVNVLPGQSTDGTGRVCIHLYVPDERGPFVEPHALHPGDEDPKQLVAKPTRGRLACDPRRKVAPTTTNGVTAVTMRTDDPRAVTCPKCIASDSYEKMMARLTAVTESK